MKFGRTISQVVLTCSMLFALYDLDYMVAGGQNCHLGAGKFHAVDNQGKNLAAR